MNFVVINTTFSSCFNLFHSTKYSKVGDNYDLIAGVERFKFGKG